MTPKWGEFYLVNLLSTLQTKLSYPIENSPFERVAQEELDSMIRFILSKEHMKINILHVEFSNVSTRELNEGGFKHIVGLKLSVKTTNFWETPRSYIYRHIG